MTHFLAHSSCICVCVCVCVRAQSCSTLSTSLACSPPGSSVHGISQASILEWVAISSSRGSSPPRDQTHISCIFCIGRQILDLLSHLGSPLAKVGRIFFFFNIAALYCCVSLCCTAKWISYTYTYINSFSLLSHVGHYRVLNRVPCVIQLTSVT